MKHLKKYKLFENNLPEVTEVEEMFQELADEWDLEWDEDNSETDPYKYVIWVDEDITSVQFSTMESSLDTIEKCNKFFLDLSYFVKNMCEYYNLDVDYNIGSQRLDFNNFKFKIERKIYYSKLPVVIILNFFPKKMKRIKLFESYDDTLETIKDILSEIVERNDAFEFRVWGENRNYTIIISIDAILNVEEYWHIPHYLKDIYNPVQHLINYMSEYKFKMFICEDGDGHNEGFIEEISLDDLNTKEIYCENFVRIEFKK